MSRYLSIVILVLGWMASLGTCSRATASEPIVLMLGIEQNLLTEADRQRFSSYKILTRPYALPGDVGKLVNIAHPSVILIRQPSGGLYEYSPNGQLIRQLSFRDTREEYLQKQQQDSEGIAPIQIYPNRSQERTASSPFPAIPAMGIGNTPPSYPPNQAAPVDDISTSIQPAIPNLANPAEQSRPPEGAVVAPKVAVPYWGAPYLSAPSMPSAAKSLPPVQSLPPLPQGSMLATNSNSTALPNYISPQYYNQVERPLPGGNVPAYLFPGRSRYSWLPGEGFDTPQPGLTASREIISQAATLAQQNFYPLWYQSFLTTNLDFSNATTTASQAATGFPNLTFTSDQTANFAVTSTQVAGTVIGIGSQLVDSFLGGRELKRARNAAQSHADGVANYYYPQAATTYYPALPRSPITNKPVYAPNGN